LLRIFQAGRFDERASERLSEFNFSMAFWTGNSRFSHKIIFSVLVIHNGGIRENS
jgi:hypothetical protein